MIDNMPPPTRRDLLELFPDLTVEEVVSRILTAEITLSDVTNEDPHRSITDDRPFNEYYAVRRRLALFRSIFRQRH
jgi:spermidine synthase